MKIDPSRCVTPMGRMSFPKVFKADAFKDQEPKFSCTILFDAKTDLSAMEAACDAAIEKEYPAKRGMPKKFKRPFRDGDDKEDLDGYAGKIFVAASNKQRPAVVDKDLSPISEESGDFYAGCYGRLALRAFCYDVNGNAGVTFSLEHVQKLKDGESFTGKMKVEDAFDSVADDAGEDDDGGF